MIGIIGAMDIETEDYKKAAENMSVRRISGIDFVTGKICGKDVVFAEGGCGKVNAAICAEAMILAFSPEIIINSGVAGGLDKRLSVADIAVANSVVQYDIDITALGEEPGLISKINKVHINCDKRACELLAAEAAAIDGTTVVVGTIATGDTFLSDDNRKRYISSQFGAVAGEMESGAIGHVCFANNVKFGIIRAISDNADGSAPKSYIAFKRTAADKTIRIVTEFIKKY